MTTPEPLVITDPTGDPLVAMTSTGRTDENEPWTIANRNLGTCPRCRGAIHAGAFLELVTRSPSVPELGSGWMHADCGPQPHDDALITAQPTLEHDGVHALDVTVTHVEGSPQP
jgi:hypothetical protein